jgi:hypothetical protein
VVEDVRFHDWTMQDVVQGIVVTSYYRMEGEVDSSPEPVSERTPAFRNVAISHMTIHRARRAIAIEGLPEMPIAGLRMTDVVAEGNRGMRASHTVGLELHQVLVNADSEPAFLVQDSQQLELDGVSTDRPLPQTPVLRLDRCPGAILRDSRAPRGTDTFLSVAPGELSGVVLEGNVFADARRPTEESVLAASAGPDRGLEP